VAAKKRDLEAIEQRMASPRFWDDSESAQGTVRKLKALKAAVEPAERLVRRIEDARTLLDLASEEKDASASGQVAAELGVIEADLGRLEFLSLLARADDPKNCYLAIHAGAGGTEACDWVTMLLRMYSRYVERAGWEMSIVDAVEGEEAGYRSVTSRVVGPYAFGYLSAESGVHRLVRISPFDSQARRHTSFASVDCLPELEDAGDVEIKDEELRLDYFRAGGAGGQHVNKTSSAVRITHLPTGIVVQCQNERSQNQNRRTAMEILRARVRRIEEQKRDAELVKLYGQKGEIAWGNQIRSYVLQPYTMVKDHRTEHETGRVQDVLDGDLNEFIESELHRRAAARSQSA
jgi:peptide chain release factor 2